ncbi:MAG: FtsX-like permease family protein [Planctomycetes bacterium]|nr:FtsX-like permease family protein [Planctomycetota bacterium]
MGLWAYTLRDIARRPGRSLFTLSGIAVGAAAAVAALVTIQAARGQYRELFEGLAGRSALEVYAPGEAGFDPALAEPLARVPGIRAAFPEVQATGGLPSWRSNAAVVVRACRPGDGPSPPDGVVLVPEQLADAHGMRPGGRLRLWGTAGLGDYTVSVLPPAETRKAGSAGFVAVSLPTARRLFGLGEQINLVRLVVEDGADPRAVREAVASALPPGLCIREPSARADITRGLRAAASCGLTGLTAVALGAAGYIVFGLAQLNLLARRSEFAVLRTLGAPARQVEGVLFRSALIFGACGGVLGTLGGAVLSWAFLRGAGAAAGLALAPPRLGWEEIALGLGLALGVSLGAIWLPARRFCRTPPLTLFRPENQVPGEPRHWTTPAALGCLAIGLWVLAECATGRLSLSTGRAAFPPALALTLAGLAGVVAPRLPPTIAGLERPVRFVFGVEGALAVRLFAERPDGAARACGVGFVAVTLAVGFGHSVLNALADVRAWTDRAIPADLLVRGAPPDPGFVLNVPLPESLGDELRALDGVAGVDRIAFVPTAANGAPVLVLARTFAPERSLPLAVRADEADALRLALARGDAVLAEGLANTLRVSAGDFVSLDTPLGPRRVRVAGVVVEFAAGGAALYLDWDTAASLFGPSGAHIFLVAAHTGQRAEAESAVVRYCAGRGLSVQRNRELRTAVDELTRGLTAGLWALLAVVVVIAALGVANGVAALAIEQRDDVRCLRAVGMSARRVRRMLRLQAVLLGTAGAPGGALCGIALSLALDRVIQGLWGYQVPFQIRWGVLSWSVGGSILAALAVGAATRDH